MLSLTNSDTIPVTMPKTGKQALKLRDKRLKRIQRVRPLKLIEKPKSQIALKPAQRVYVEGPPLSPPALSYEAHRAVEEQKERARQYMLQKLSEVSKPMSEIMKEVCKKHGISVLEVKSNRRLRKISVARAEYFWRCKNETSRTFPQIGKSINKDHSTALYGANRHQLRLNSVEATYP